MKFNYLLKDIKLLRYNFINPKNRLVIEVNEKNYKIL